MQYRKLQSVLIRFLLAGLILLQAGMADAQKRSKKNKIVEKTEIAEQSKEPVAITPEQRRKAEMYHIDAEKYYILEDYAKSFVLYQKSLEMDPGNATAYNRTAQIYLKNDDFDKAVVNAQKAIELDPTNKFFYLTLAEIYSKKSDFENAALAYQKMIDQCPNTDEYLFELAAIYVFQKNFTAALGIYDRIEETFGINEEVILQKQKLFLKQSMLDEAVAEGQKLIDAHPGDPKYKLILAEILISNNQPEKAITYLKSVLEVDKENPRALLMLSDISRNNGDIESADKYLTQAFGNPELNLNQKMQVLVGFMQKLPDENAEKLCIGLGDQIIKAHPEESDAYAINGDLMMNLRESESAHQYYLKALKLGNSNYNIWQNIIQLEVSLELYDDAIKHGDEALELFPNQAALYWFIGSAYMANKDEIEAVGILEQGLKMTGSNNELKSFFHAQLGDAYNNLKEYAKSDKSYEAALSIDPNNDHVLNNYSYFLALRKEKLDLAKKMSTKLVEENPDDPTYLDTHAWVLYMLTDYVNARIFIEKALKGENISGTVLEHYGDILFKLGEIDAAIVQWQKAKGLDETSDLIDKKIADRKLYE